MRILVINPNSDVEKTKTIGSAAKKYASPGTEIATVNPQDGPVFLVDAYDEAVQVHKVIDLVEKNRNNYDAFIIACGSDPGLEACRVIAKNVIGIGEAAIMTACAVAKRFSVLCVTKNTEPAAWEQLRYLGIAPSRCASVRVVGNATRDEAVKERHKMIDVYCQVGQRCIDEDGASALVFDGAGLDDIKEVLEERLKVPVISGVISAVKIVEQLPFGEMA